MPHWSAAPSRAVILGLGFSLAAVSCGSEPEPAAPGYDFGLPPGFTAPWVPQDNPMSAEKASLGRKLFFDQRLSGNGTMSCSSCHERAKGFADGKDKPTGSTGDLVPRNA